MDRLPQPRHGRLSGLLERHPGGTLIVVGHTETLAAMLHLLLGVPTP